MCVCVCVCVFLLSRNSLEDLLLLLLKKRRIHLLLYYVTEESDDPENPNGIVEHHLPWRSESEFTGLLLSVLIRAFL